jgi:hypothetical protein
MNIQFWCNLLIYILFIKSSLPDHSNCGGVWAASYFDAQEPDF